jgi:hypothetical protein
VFYEFGGPTAQLVHFAEKLPENCLTAPEVARDLAFAVTVPHDVFGDHFGQRIHIAFGKGLVGLSM